VNEVTGTGDVYTMAEAARLKGVSYHTVSRAVRRGKLPATRLGRMALITSEDLRDWRPMRERAPRKYRRREPNPEATPALLDLASAERVELASRLASLSEALYAAAAGMPRDEFFGLLAERLAGALGMRRVAIRVMDESSGRTMRLGTYGSPLTNLPDETYRRIAAGARSLAPGEGRSRGSQRAFGSRGGADQRQLVAHRTDPAWRPIHGCDRG